MTETTSEPRHPGAIAVSGATLLAQGTVTDSSGRTRTGTWAFPTDGFRGQVYLGASTGFHPFVDGRTAWLTNGAAAWAVDVSGGTTVDGPYPLNGRLVADVGRCPIVQRGDQILCWTPGQTPESFVIGRDTVLA